MQPSSQTPSTKSQLRQLIERTHQRQLAQLDALSPAEREAAGTSEQWSAKDTLAHTMYWKERLAERLEAAKSGAPMAASEGDVQARNEENFAANATRPLVDVLAGNARIHTRVLAALDVLSEDDLVTPGRFPALNGFPLAAAVIGNLGHTNEHLVQPYLDRGDIDGAVRAHETFTNEIVKSGLPAEATARALYDLAVFYTIIGRTDEALANLTAAVQMYPQIAKWAKDEDAFVALRGEPEFQALYSE